MGRKKREREKGRDFRLLECTKALALKKKKCYLRESDDVASIHARIVRA